MKADTVPTDAEKVPRPSRRYIPFHPKRIARKLQADPRFAADPIRTEQFMNIFRIYRGALRLQWMRHTDVLRLLAHDLGGINPDRVALGAGHSRRRSAATAAVDNLKDTLPAAGNERAAAATPVDKPKEIWPATDDDHVGLGNARESRKDGADEINREALPEFVDSLHLLADKANYDLLSEEWMERSLFSPTLTKGGITVVPLNRQDYSTILVWVRGRHMGQHISVHDRHAGGYVNRLRDAVETTLRPVMEGNQAQKDRKELERFSSVLVAVRMTAEKDPSESLHLSLFKDVPTSQLHLLLPDVGVSMSHADRVKILFMGGVGGLTVAAKTAAVAYCAAGAQLKEQVIAKGGATAVVSQAGMPTQLSNLCWALLCTAFFV